MKTCVGCKYALWKYAKGLRLHPSGDGTCKYPYNVPKLPASMYWIGATPMPSGGYINRRKDFEEHCVYWSLSVM